VLNSFQQWFDVNVADTEELRRACFRLRYQVYCVENPFEDSNAFPDGMETDAYDDHAVQILMTDRRTGDPIGACRVVLPFGDRAGRRLPLQDVDGVTWTRSAALFPPGRVGEISRFCIAKAYRKGRTVGEAKLGLARMSFRVALAHRLTHVCCVMDPLLLRLLDRLGLDLGPQGPLIEHHGLRQPCVTSLRDLFATARRRREEVWEIVTEDGELWDAACALESQIAAASARPAPARVPGCLPAAMLPVGRRVERPRAAVS
jgi:N-acyl-L-homoserine lactone synthetase